MRTIFIARAILMVAGCSGSAETPQTPQMSEETAAAELMHGLLDRVMTGRLWVEQKGTSPAVFDLHASDGTFKMTVSKAATCKYLTRLEIKDAVVEFSEDLTGMDPGQAGDKSGMEMRNFPGSAVICAKAGGERDLCKEFDRFQTGQVPAMLPATKDRLKQLATDFKAKYCS